MSNSALVSHTKISPNRTKNRKHAIDTITIHCTAGQVSVETLGSIFAKPSTKASSNYGIGSDGRVGLYVEEQDRSWASSSPANDHRAVTIEVASDGTHPYAVNDKAYAALIDLLEDICRRNGIKQLLWQGDRRLAGQVDRQNMTAHRWFANKACPGDWLYNRFGEIAAAVNARLGTDAGRKKSENTEKKVEGKCMVELRVLQKGSTGAEVKTLQALLIKKYGISCGGSGVDGSFGAFTDKAVKAFQASKSLTVDGSVGPKTWAALLK